MDLSAYLTRIGYAGDLTPTRETLAAVQRAHLLAIPYENLDVQLGRPRTTAVAEAYAKMVGGRRGGWCYDMNGLLGWALKEMGFSVRRLATGVYRSGSGDEAVGNHLVLRVDFEDGLLLADAGLAGGPFTPYPAVEGEFSAHGFNFRLEAVEDGWWRLHNHPAGMAPNFDFHLERTDEAALSRVCQHLQTDPQSIFVQNLVCQKFTPDGEIQLRGRVLRRTTPAGVDESVLGSADEFMALLGSEFDIDEPEAAGLWPRICERHAELFAAST